MSTNRLPGAYKKSGGPKTEQGKSKSSLNALKLGAYATMPLLPNEDPKDYQALHDALISELGPQSVLMHQMATTIVNLTWRLKRIDYFEANFFRAEYETPIDQWEIDKVLNGKFERVQIAQRRITDKALANGFGFYEKRLFELGEFEASYPQAWPDLAILKNRYSDLYSLFKHFSGYGDSFDQMVTRGGQDAHQAAERLKTLEKTRAWLQTQVDDFVLLAEYERAIQKIRDVRVFRMLVEDKAARPRNELYRALQQAIERYQEERDRHHRETAILVNTTQELLIDERPSDAGSAKPRTEVENASQ